MPYIKPPRRPMRPFLWSFGFLAALFIVLIAAPLAVFGPDAVLRLQDPILAVLDTSNSSILIFQTIGTLVLTLFIPLFLVAAAVNLWASLATLREISGLNDSFWWPLLASAALFWLSTKSLGWPSAFLLQMWGMAYGLSYLWAMLWLWPILLWTSSKRQPI
jgi:hypothetical protein